jgi:hypothetical protein
MTFTSGEAFDLPGQVMLYGVPQTTGAFAPTLTVTDANGLSATQTFPLHISALDQQPLFGCTFLLPCTQTIYVDGGTPPYSATGTGFPFGVGITPGTVNVTGSPAESGSGSFTVTTQVTDSSTPPNTLSRTSPLSVYNGTNPIVITNAGNLTVTAGSSLSVQLKATGGSGAYIWGSGTAIFSADHVAPPWLYISEDGAMSGTPPGPGVYLFGVDASDANNPSASPGTKFFTLTVTPIAVTTSSLPYGNVGTAYSQTLAATGASGTLTWTLNANNYLPPGIALSSAGVLGGTPASEGTYQFTVTATDESANTATNNFTMVVYPAGGGPAADGTLTAASATAAPGSAYVIPSSVCTYTTQCFLVTPGAFSIPVSLNLMSGVTANSLMFDAQFTPIGGAPALTAPVNFTGNASIAPAPSVSAATSGASVAWSGLTTPLSGSVALGAVTGTLPASAAVGQSYTVAVTSAGAALSSTPVPVAAAPNGAVIVGNTYLVGDVDPSTSDTAPDFGDGVLNILDLIQELFAVNNVPGFVPAACSDRLDAMDTYPADTPTTRGGDRALDIRDLILELFRANNLDLNRPVRASLGGALLWPACTGGSTGDSSNSTAVTRRPAVSPRPQGAPRGALAVGPPEISGVAEEQVPVYLEARQNLVKIAITFALGDQRSQLRFVPTLQAPPSFAQDRQLGVVAVAWLNGVSLEAGGQLLLGYVTGPAGFSAKLKVYGVSASGLVDNSEVRLDAPGEAGMGR